MSPGVRDKGLETGGLTRLKMGEAVDGRPWKQQGPMAGLSGLLKQPMNIPEAESRPARTNKASP